MHQELEKDVQALIDAYFQRECTLSEKERRTLHTILTKIRKNQTHTYTLFADSNPVPERSGGGIAARRNIPNPDTLIGTVQYRIEKTPFIVAPSNRLWFDLWGTKNMRFPIAVRDAVTLTGFHGEVDVENAGGGSPISFWVDCTEITGNPRVPARHQLGFKVGFETAGANIKKFFISTEVFERETTNPVSISQIANRIPVTGMGAKFTADTVTLDDTLLAAYNGGAGLKFNMILSIYGKR
jgi:hypothetical protein